MKFRINADFHLGLTSPPSRGAWIEIGTVKSIDRVVHVAPLAGGVD